MSPLRALAPLPALLLLALAAAPAPAAQTDADPVRVRLFGIERPASVTLRGAEGAVALQADGRDAGELDGEATLSAHGGRVALRGGGVDLDAARLEIDGTTGIRFGRVDRTYTGRLTASVESGRLQIVNHVPMPDYVASVVASEYGFPEIEGVKAQAVLVRTYALQRRRSGRAYDVEDNQSSQVYKGRGVATATSRRAAEETDGEVLTFRGALIEALYSSSSGGHTSSNETAWGTPPVPYLRAVPDPFDAAAPDHQWTTTAPRDRVLAALSRRFGGVVSGVTVLDRSPEGRVLRVALDGANQPTVSGTAFQSAVNNVLGWRTIRSTHFEVARRGDEYVFDGRGFGHGVGMSQYGARGQAREGRTYHEILAYYFSGTDLVAQGVPVTPRTSPTRTTVPDVLVATADRPAPTPRAETGATPTAWSASTDRPRTAPTRRSARQAATEAPPVLPEPQRVVPTINRGEALIVRRPAPVEPAQTIRDADPDPRPAPRVVALSEVAPPEEEVALQRPPRRGW
jgi:stage II sporulation protein D